VPGTADRSSTGRRRAVIRRSWTPFPSHAGLIGAAGAAALGEPSHDPTGAIAPGLWQDRLMIRSGDPAPEFELPDQDGEIVRLVDLRGSWVLLWWYPKAATPG
jgi:hypothetical protein